MIFLNGTFLTTISSTVLLKSSKINYFVSNIIDYKYLLFIINGNINIIIP